jgi:drug/metabolite transporter (DMT)-like permease
MNSASVWHRLEPVALLLAAGLCIGMIFPLGKLAAIAGLPPLLFIGLSAAGGSLVLGAIALLAGARIVFSRETVLYAAIAGQITFAIPFGVLIAVIPHIGSGIPAIFQSLAPIITLAIVYALGMERPNPLRTTGLAAGLAGALIILFFRNAGTLDTSAPLEWYVAALVTPIALAVGNVYRTRKWPGGQRPLPLATLSLAAAALGIFLVIGVSLAFGNGVEFFAPLAAGWRLILMQSLATGFGYAFFFRLQKIGGPVYISQISYVNTGVGVAFAALFFTEQLTVWIWLALALVCAGVALVSRTHRPATSMGETRIDFS